MREGLEAVRAYSRTVVGKERLVEAVIKEVRHCCPQRIVSC